jgi:hypothetical protein
MIKLKPILIMNIAIASFPLDASCHRVLDERLLLLFCDAETAVSVCVELRSTSARQV